MSEKDVCPLCGLPKELCVCSDLSADEQEIIISNDRRKWGKVVTLLTFKGNFDADLEEILKKAKRKIGAGGTVRGGKSVELRGDHRFRMKKFLIDLGYSEDLITITE
ncbi:MAG: stress response translation initiation inhibitor YciH [Candidatus Lokiarchaeota archaeon]|nr:stress response translation initiation inhibitor YciH [Candidatus Lokiarchaeota archaeon]MBD3340818.1 stress response translation initiation inhibitor YciH [Candidatus Lokiarchaeota archaeon]